MGTTVKKDKIVFIFDAHHGSQYYRMQLPALRLKHKGYNVAAETSLIDYLEKTENFDDVAAIVFQRFAVVTQHQKLKEHMNANGVKIVVDVDDRWFIDNDKTHAEWYNKNSRHFIEATIKIADVVWCGSKYLAKRVENSFNLSKKKVFYVPNGIYPEINGWNKTEQPQGEHPVFVYTGALGHKYDIGVLKGAFDNNPIHVVDFNAEGYANYSTHFGKAAIPHKPYELYNYHELYEQANVAIAPLLKTDFNLCKSNLKVVESGFKGRAIIASNIPLYSEIIEHGKNGILCDTKAEWLSAIKNMSVSQSIELGEALYETVKTSYHIDTTNAARLYSIFS